MRITKRRAGAIVGGGLAAVAIGYLGYAATTWIRYGRRLADAAPDTLLDRYMPQFEIQEQHEIRVAAPSDITYEALLAMDLRSSPLVRAIFRGRELILRADHAKESDRRSLLDETLAIGWRVLAEERTREIVVGAVTRPWDPTPTFRGVPASEFAAFDEPRYVKIVWTLSVEPIDASSSIARTETRVATTDSYARRRFRRYWSTFSPGVLLIRKEGLRLARADAERRYRAAIARAERAPASYPGGASLTRGAR